MSIQQNGFNPLLTQRAVSTNSIDAGIAAGNTFDGRGNDFLSPNNILGNVDDFSKSVSPITSNNNFAVIADPFGKNPKSSGVLRGTSSSINDILSPGFGLNLMNAATNVGTTGGAISATTGGTIVNTTTTVNGQIVQTPSPSLIRDLSSFNPLIWQNPNSTNVLLGTMDAQNKIFGGGGIIIPPGASQFPLYPFIALPSPPFSGNSFGIPSQNGINTLQQAQMFPATFGSNSPFYNTVFQPFSISTTQSITPYQVQVTLIAMLRNMAEQSTISTGGISQLVPPNGVPPWIS